MRFDPAVQHMDFAQIVQTVTLYAIPVLLAITLHEAAHGYAALQLGDKTAALLGRISMNPLRHIDPVGTIAMPLMLYFATSGAFLFGYAKPVPVNFGRLHHPKRDMVWVALAGPGANLLQAALWMTLFYMLRGVGIEERFWIDMARAGVAVNLVMFAFNLFPLPPLDGGRILVGLLPMRAAVVLSRVEPFGFFLVLALVLTGIVGQYWLRPLMDITTEGLAWLLTPLRWLLF